jgi:cellulose biosynthesis protein BcsQ
MYRLKMPETQKMSSQPTGEIITFYSYKGGTGRSMALANVACLLSKRPEAKGRGVLMVDWDLEAPGLHRYFYNQFSDLSPRDNDTERAVDDRPGLLDLFMKLETEIPVNGYGGKAKMPPRPER